MFCGTHAIVVGGGMSGMAAAAALAGHFELVTVLERDEYPAEPAPRPGTPQGRFLHALPMGGQHALNELLPGIAQELEAAGAVPLRLNADIHYELPGLGAMPRRDFGWMGHTMSRPLLEHVVRHRIQQLSNVMLLDRCRVTALLSDGKGAVNGVSCAVADGELRALRGDLVIDASARRSLTEMVLEVLHVPQPDVTNIGIDMTYVMMAFESGVRTGDWKLALTLPDTGSGEKAGYLVPIEGGRWQVVVGQPHIAMPSDSPDDFMRLVRQLPTSTIYDAIKNAKPLTNRRPVERLSRFLFSDSSWLHYERLASFPHGLLPIGDAICRFNPIYGQGMAVAFKEAVILKALLRSRANDDKPLHGLANDYFTAIQPSIETAWSMSSIPDFAIPATRGKPPSDLEHTLRFTGALMRLAVRDADAHRIFSGVQQMVMPHTALQDPDLVRRVQMEMADA